MEREMGLEKQTLAYKTQYFFYALVTKPLTKEVMKTILFTIASKM
jgi:hypothetical protein